MNMEEVGELFEALNDAGIKMGFGNHCLFLNYL